MLANLAYSDLSSYVETYQVMKKSKPQSLEKHLEFVSDFMDGDQQRILDLIERKKQLKRSKEEESWLVQDSLIKLSHITNQERVAKFAVALEDSQDLYFQVLRTIRDGQSEYIRRNGNSGEFEFSLNLRLQN